MALTEELINQNLSMIRSDDPYTTFTRRRAVLGQLFAREGVAPDDPIMDKAYDYFGLSEDKAPAQLWSRAEGVVGQGIRALQEGAEGIDMVWEGGKALTGMALDDEELTQEGVAGVKEARRKMGDIRAYSENVGLDNPLTTFLYDATSSLPYMAMGVGGGALTAKIAAPVVGRWLGGMLGYASIDAALEGGFTFGEIITDPEVKKAVEDRLGREMSDADAQQIAKAAEAEVLKLGKRGAEDVSLVNFFSPINIAESMGRGVFGLRAPLPAKTLRGRVGQTVTRVGGREFVEEAGQSALTQTAVSKARTDAYTGREDTGLGGLVDETGNIDWGSAAYEGAIGTFIGTPLGARPFLREQNARQAEKNLADQEKATREEVRELLLENDLESIDALHQGDDSIKDIVMDEVKKAKKSNNGKLSTAAQKYKPGTHLTSTYAPNTGGAAITQDTMKEQYEDAVQRRADGKSKIYDDELIRFAENRANPTIEDFEKHYRTLQRLNKFDQDAREAETKPSREETQAKKDRADTTATGQTRKKKKKKKVGGQQGATGTTAPTESGRPLTRQEPVAAETGYNETSTNIANNIKATLGDEIIKRKAGTKTKRDGSTRKLDLSARINQAVGNQVNSEGALRNRIGRRELGPDDKAQWFFSPDERQIATIAAVDQLQSEGHISEDEANEIMRQLYPEGAIPQGAPTQPQTPEQAAATPSADQQLSIPEAVSYMMSPQGYRIASEEEATSLLNSYDPDAEYFTIKDLDNIFRTGAPKRESGYLSETEAVDRIKEILTTSKKGYTKNIEDFLDRVMRQRENELPPEERPINPNLKDILRTQIHRTIASDVLEAMKRGEIEGFWRSERELGRKDVSDTGEVRESGRLVDQFQKNKLTDSVIGPILNRLTGEKGRGRAFMYEDPMGSDEMREQRLGFILNTLKDPDYQGERQLDVDNVEKLRVTPAKGNNGLVLKDSDNNPIMQTTNIPEDVVMVKVEKDKAKYFMWTTLFERPGFWVEVASTGGEWRPKMKNRKQDPGSTPSFDQIEGMAATKDIEPTMFSNILRVDTGKRGLKSRVGEELTAAWFMLDRTDRKSVDSGNKKYTIEGSQTREEAQEMQTGTPTRRRPMEQEKADREAFNRRRSANRMFQKVEQDPTQDLTGVEKNIFDHFKNATVTRGDLDPSLDEATGKSDVLSARLAPGGVYFEQGPQGVVTLTLLRESDSDPQAFEKVARDYGLEPVDPEDLSAGWIPQELGEPVKPGPDAPPRERMPRADSEAYWQEVFDPEAVRNMRSNIKDRAETKQAKAVPDWVKKDIEEGGGIIFPEEIDAILNGDSEKYPQLSLPKSLRLNNAPIEEGGDSEGLRQVKRRVHQKIKETLLQIEPTTEGERGTEYFFVPDLWAAVDALNKPETLARLTEKYFDANDLSGRGGYESVQPWIEMLGEIRAAIPEMTRQYQESWNALNRTGDLLEARFAPSINSMDSALRELQERISQLEEQALTEQARIEDEEGSDVSKLRSLKENTDDNVKGALAAYTRRLRGVKEPELESAVEDLFAPLGQLLSMEQSLRNNLDMAVGAMETSREQASEMPAGQMAGTATPSDKEMANRTAFPNLEDVDTPRSGWQSLSKSQEQMKTKIYNLLEPKGLGDRQPPKGDPSVLGYMSQTLGTKFKPQQAKAANGQMTVYLPPSNTMYVIGQERMPWMDAAALGWVRENVPEWEGGAEVRPDRVRALVGPTSMGLDNYAAQTATRKQVQGILNITDAQMTRVADGLAQIGMYQEKKGIVYDELLEDMNYTFAQDGELADILTGVMQSAGVTPTGDKAEKLRRDIRAAMKDWLRGYASLETSPEAIEFKLNLAVEKDVLTQSEADSIKKKL